MILSEILALRKMVINLLYGEKAGDPQPCRIGIFAEYNGEDVHAAVRALNMSPVRTSFASPWQNGIAERWVGSCRRELLDHVIPLDERHLKRLLREYISYHNGVSYCPTSLCG